MERWRFTWFVALHRYLRLVVGMGSDVMVDVRRDELAVDYLGHKDFANLNLLCSGR